MRNIKMFVLALIVTTFSFSSLADVTCRTDSSSLSDELIITQLTSGKFRAEILNRLIVANLKNQAIRSMGMKIDNKTCNVRVLRDGILRLDNLNDQRSNFSAGDNCPYIVQEENGLRIVFPYLHMISARRSEIIEMANWKFNECHSTISFNF